MLGVKSYGQIKLDSENMAVSFLFWPHFGPNLNLKVATFLMLYFYTSLSFRVQNGHLNGIKVWNKWFPIYYGNSGHPFVTTSHFIINFSNAIITISPLTLKVAAKTIPLSAESIKGIFCSISRCSRALYWWPSPWGWSRRYYPEGKNLESLNLNIKNYWLPGS